MAPQAAPVKPGAKGKRLPLWAWGVAAAGGVLIGVFLLRRQGGGAGAGESEGEDSGSKSGGSGTEGASTPPGAVNEALTQALGLAKHDVTTHNGGGGGGGGDSSYTEASGGGGLYYGDPSTAPEGTDHIVGESWGSGGPGTTPEGLPGPSGFTNIGGIPTPYQQVPGAGKIVE